MYRLRWPVRRSEPVESHVLVDIAATDFLVATCFHCQTFLQECGPPLVLIARLGIQGFDAIFRRKIHVDGFGGRLQRTEPVGYIKGDVIGPIAVVLNQLSNGKGLLSTGGTHGCHEPAVAQ